MTKQRERRYRGIMIGLIFGLLMTGVMSLTVFAEETENPPSATEALESAGDVLTDEDALAGPDAAAESLSEDADSAADENKGEDAQSTDSASSSESSAAQEETGSGTADTAVPGEQTEEITSAAASGTDSGSEDAAADGTQTETDTRAEAAGTKSEAAAAAETGTVSENGADTAVPAESEEPARSRVLLAGASGDTTTPTSPTLTGEMADLTDSSTSLTGDESLKGTATAEQADVENAIQKAIDAALASAASTTTTLRVDVESGDYTGGLKIAKPEGSTLNTKLILYVFAPGSYSGADTGAITTGKISAAADGSTKVSGDILIDGINVVLAGLYYSLDTKITVRDAKADIYGTAESDTINTVLDGKGTLVVHSGAGADDISVSGSTTTGGVVATVYGEKGDDKFTVDLISGTKNASGTAPKQAEVRISDTDNGTLELTGTLQEGNSNALSGTITMTSTSKRARVTAVNSEGYKTYINANGTTDYIDSLLNKKEVVLNPGDSVKAASFTDYVLTGTNVDGVTVDGANAYFSNIKAVSDGTLTVGSIEAPLVNVLLQGTEIILNGTINAKNLTVRSTGKVNQRQEDLTIELAGVDTISVRGIVDAQTAKIQVLKDADLKANSIQLTAETAASVDRDALIGTYGDRILSFEELISRILIDGKIEAAAGSIKALAGTAVTILTAADARASFDSLVALPEAVVTIGKNAELISAGDVVIKAVSRVVGAVKASLAEDPYAADAVTAIGGKAATTMAGRILAGGNVTVAADGSIQAETNVSGSDTGLAVTTASQDVTAKVEGSGTIEALGSVDILSALSGDFRTTASAGGQDQGYGTTLANTLKTLGNILNAVSGFAGEDTGAILANLFAVMTEAQSGQYAGIGTMYEQAASSMKDGAVQASSAQNAFGATAVSYTGGTNFAGIDTNGVIYAGSGLSVRANADFVSVVRADSFETAADEANPSAAAAANMIFENTAEIGSGTVYAKDLTVSAVSGKQTRPVTSVVKAYAGDGVYDGAAGAAALQKALASTKALIRTGAAINLQNRTSLFVKAEEYDRFVTVADAAAAGNGTTDGSGAGLAFAVTGADVRSAVEDGVTIKSFSPKTGASALKRDEISDYIAGLTLIAPMVDQVAVTADRQGDEVIYASAGTDGGDENAIRAESALFSGSSVQAYLGETGLDEVLDAAGNVDVTANNAGARQAAADSAAAAGTGSGMTLTMTYTSDKSSTDLRRALKSNVLTVRAVSNVKTRSRAKAGAKGTKTVKENGNDGEDGEADQRAAKILDGAAAVASTGNSAISGSIIQELGTKSAKAKNAEGSMGAAAAYAKNTEMNSAKASVSGKYNIIASGDLILEAIGENGADILADASSVKKDSDGSAEGSTTGIGTAAAVSVVEYDFSAVLNSGKVAATSVTIRAGIPEEAAGTYKAAAISGAGDGQIGLVGSIAVNEVHGTSEALIADGPDQISAAQDMIIRADDLHTEETVATAAVSGDGSPVKTADGEDLSNVGVGAAFALSDVRTITKAAVGAGRVVEGLRVYILANNKDVRGTYSAAGTDPAADGQEFEAAAADGSAAVTIGVNSSIALADQNAQIIASGTSDGSEIERTGEPKTGDIYIKGLFESDVRTIAGIFGAGDRTYSGGTVAVDLAASDAVAEMRGFATANGNVLILADSDDKDETEAVSGVKPADLRRYLARIELPAVEENALAFSRGQISGYGKNAKNEIAALISEALNLFKDQAGKKVSGTNPLTYNVLASQNAKSEGTDEESIRQAQEESNQIAASGMNVSVGEGIVREDLAGTKIRTAAALGLNVTAHNAHALVSGTVDKTNRSTDIRAEVTSSAKVRGSASKASADGNGLQNALGAALSVNRNTAVCEIAKGESPARVESQGAVSLTAEQQRNVSANDREGFEAEAAPGTYSNEQGLIFGTLVIVRSESQTKALAAEETMINANLGSKGGDVTVMAYETGRIAAKTSGTVYGPAFVIADVKDSIQAEIGAKAQVTGSNITVQALKQKAGEIPEFNAFADGKDYVAITSLRTEEDSIYEVQADTAAFSDFIKNLSEAAVLSGADYYLEALSNQTSTAALNGPEAQGTSMILREALRVGATIGKEAVLTAEKNIDIQSGTSSKAVILLGASDFGNVQSSEYGTSLVLMTSENVTEAVIGDDAKLTAGGNYTQKASEDAVRTAAVLPGVSDADGVVSPGGGSVIALMNRDAVCAEAGTGVLIEGALGAEIGTDLQNDMSSLVAPKTGENSGKAKGGNSSYLHSAFSVLTKVGNNSKIRSSQGNVSLTADTKEQMISIPGPNAEALSGAIAALMNIMRSEGTTIVETGKVEITAKKDVRLSAQAAGYLVTVDMAADTSSLYSPKGAAIFYDAARCVETLLGEGSSVTAGGDVYMISALDEKLLIMLLPVKGTDGAGLSGLAAGSKSRNIVRTVAGTKSGQDWTAADAADATAATSVIADGSIAVTAVLDSVNEVVTAGLNGDGNVTAGGAAAAIVEKNIVDAVVSNMAYLKAMASMAAIPVEKAGTDSNGKKKTDSRTGITLYAGAKESILMTVEGSGASGESSVNGTIADVNVANTVRARAGKEAQLFAGTKIADEFTGEIGDLGTSGDVHIEAEDQTDAMILAGGLRKAGAQSESPTVFYGFFGKTVSAKNEGLLAAAQNAAEVIAKETTNVNSFVTASGPAAEAAGVSGAVYFRNRADAFASGYLRGGKTVSVTSASSDRLNNVETVRDKAAGSGNTGSALLVYLYNGASSLIGDGSQVAAGDVVVAADSTEDVSAYVQGTTGEGAQEVKGGSLLVVLTGSEAVARIGENASVGGAYSEKAGDVTIRAKNTYTLKGIVGTDVNTNETKGGISAAASVSYNKVEASVGSGTQMKVKSLSVNADSVRTVNLLSAMLGANGNVETAGTAAVVAIGSLLNGDAHSAIFAGGQSILPGAAGRYILQNGGTAVRFNDFTEDSLPSIDLEGLLAVTGLESVGETIDMASGTGKYASLLQPEGDAASDPATAVYKSLDGTITRDAARYNGYEDKVSAWLESGVVVEAESDITVSAKDLVNLYVTSGAVGNSAAEGVGSGTAAVFLNGDVNAYAYGTLKSGGKIDITAAAESGLDAREDLAFRETTVLKSLAHAGAQKGVSAKQEVNRTGIYALAIAGAQGAPGGRDNVAYASIGPNVTARLYGTVKDADWLNILSVYGFGNVHATSIAAGTGNKDITRILALEYYDGSVEAGITNEAAVNLSGKTLDVKTQSAAAMAPRACIPGSGMDFSLAVTAAAAVNRTNAHAYIAGGVQVNAEAAEITVEATMKSEADVKIPAVKADVCALDMGLAIVVNDPANLAYIGSNSINNLPHAGSKNGTGSIKAMTVYVNASMQAKTNVQGYLLSNGRINHLNGLVVIGIAMAKNNASAAGTNIQADQLIIRALSDNDMTVTSETGENKVYGIGGTVALGFIGSENYAELYVTDAVIDVADLTVSTGEDRERVTANVTVTVNPGGLVRNLGKAMNIASARNELLNLARVIGGEDSRKMGVITAGNNVKVCSALDSLAKAEIRPSDRTRGAIGAGAAFAKQSGNAPALIIYTRVTANNIYVRSWYNSKPGGETVGSLLKDRGAIAVVTPAQDPYDILAKHLTSAEAVFTGVSHAEMYGCDARAAYEIVVIACAQSYAKALMDAPKVTYNYGRIGMNMVNADASGVFIAQVVEPLANGTFLAKYVDIEVFYIAMSDAQTSMIGGRKVTKDGKQIEYNSAKAYTGTFAEAALKRLVSGDPTVFIFVTGRAGAHAYVPETVFSYEEANNAFDVMAAVTTAEIAVEQRAHMDPETLTSATMLGRIEIRSILYGYTYLRDAAGEETVSGACAETGYPVFEENSMGPCLLPMVFNKADATARAVNLAYIYGPGEIYSKNGVLIVAETNLDSNGGVRLSPQGVETAMHLGTAVSALTRNRTEASIGSCILIVVHNERKAGIRVVSTDSSNAKAESLFASGVPSEDDMAKLVRAGIGTLDQDSAFGCAEADPTCMSITSSRVGDHTYLEGAYISLATVNNNWAEAGMKAVDGYHAEGGYVNMVPTVMAVFCGVAIGDQTTMLATAGTVDLHTHSYLDSAVKVNSSTTQFAKKESISARNYIRQSERIIIGEGAYIEAHDDISVVIRGTVRMAAYATDGNAGSKQGAETTALNKLRRDEQIDLSKQARLRSWYGNITLNIIASGDDVNNQDTGDYIQASVSQKRDSGKSLTGLRAQNNIEVQAVINTWENSEIYVPFGTANLKVQDGYGDNTSTNSNRRISVAAKAGGIAGVRNGVGNILTENSYKESLKVNVKHSTITGNNVNLTASREAMDIISEALVKMTDPITSGAVLDSINTLDFGADVAITDGSYVRGYSNVSILAKTESMDDIKTDTGKSRIRADADVRNSTFGWADARNRGSVKETVAIEDASFIYGRTITMIVFGWLKGDEVDNHGLLGEATSYFALDSDTEKNEIVIDEDVVLFVGSMAGAVLDIAWNEERNILELRQIGLDRTPDITANEYSISIVDIMTPDRIPGALRVDQWRRLYDNDMHDREIAKRFEERAVSGGALSDITILNRTGLETDDWKGIYIERTIPQGMFEYYNQIWTDGRGYEDTKNIARAAQDYPAGGLISEVYYEDPIIAPTVTHVSSLKPRSFSVYEAHGARSTVVVYRDFNGQLRTEVQVSDSYRTTYYSNSERELSDAGSYYSFAGTRPDWTIDFIMLAYSEQMRPAVSSQTSSASGGRNTVTVSGSANTADANAGGSTNTADANAGGSTAQAEEPNAQSETAGNQTAGNASDGIPDGVNSDIKGSQSDVDPANGSEGTSQAAMGGKVLPIAAAAAAGALFIIFLLLKRRKKDEEQ